MVSIIIIVLKASITALEAGLLTDVFLNASAPVCKTVIREF